MALSALITVKLKGATEDQKSAFSDFLKENNIDKIPKLATTYELNFVDGVTREDALEAVEVMINSAAQNSKVPSYKAAYQIGEGDVELIEN